MANLVYQNDEAALTWRDSGGDYAMTLANLASGAGRQGLVHDFGIAARADRYAWRAWCQTASAGTVGAASAVYIKTGGTDEVPLTRYDNDDGTGDIALSSTDKLRNLTFLKYIILDEAATGVPFVASGFVELPHRYVMPVMVNNFAVNWVNTANLNGFSLTPVPSEIQ